MTISKSKICKAPGCKNKFIPFNSLHIACSLNCSLLIESLKKEKAKKKEKKRDKKRLAELRPRSYWIKKAQISFNRYIRKRDEHQPCISCQRHHNGQYHAGHYLTTLARPELRFHPANCHKQCMPCNTHLSGNIALYRTSLIEKVSDEMVEYLENFNNVQNLTIDEIKEIEIHFKLLYKSL